MRNGEEEIVDEVVLVADEVGAFRFLNEHLNISGDALEFGSVALAGSIDHHAFGHASRDVDFNDFLALNDTFAVALRALVLNHLARSVTVGAGGLALHHAEDAALRTHHATCAVTVGAGLRMVARFAARAVAIGTGDVLAHLELLGNARGNFLQREFHLQAQVATFELGRTATATAATKSAEAHVAEDIAELSEDVAKVHALESAAAKSACAIHACCAELIVACALLGVAEHLIGFSGLLELLLGFLVARVAVGVVLDGHLLIGFLDFVCRGRLVHA